MIELKVLDSSGDGRNYRSVLSSTSVRPGGGPEVTFQVGTAPTPHNSFLTACTCMTCRDLEYLPGIVSVNSQYACTTLQVMWPLILQWKIIQILHYKRYTTGNLGSMNCRKRIKSTIFPAKKLVEMSQSSLNPQNFC